MGVIHEVWSGSGWTSHCRMAKDDGTHRRTALRLSARAGRHPSHFALFHFLAHIQEEVHRFAVPSTGRNAARRLSTANWSRSRGSGTRRSRPCCAISARWKRSVRPTSKNFRRWSGGKGEKNQGLFRKIAVFFEKLRKSPIFVHPIRRVTLAEMPDGGIGRRVGLKHQ